MAYRVLSTGEPQITVINRGSTYWMRFFAHLRAKMVPVLWLTPMGLLFAVMTAGLFAAFFQREGFAYELARVLPYFVSPPIVLVVVVSLIAATRRTPHERLLPRRLVLRERAIDVYTPTGEEALDQRWTYIVDATETVGAFVLVLRREPLLKLVIAKRGLSAVERELIGRWLRDNGCLRA